MVTFMENTFIIDLSSIVSMDLQKMLCSGGSYSEWTDFKNVIEKKNAI